MNPYLVKPDETVFSMARLEEYLRYRRRMAPYTVYVCIKQAKTLVRHYGLITSDYGYATRLEEDMTRAGRSANHETVGIIKKQSCALEESMRATKLLLEKLEYLGGDTSGEYQTPNYIA